MNKGFTELVEEQKIKRVEKITGTPDRQTDNQQQQREKQKKKHASTHVQISSQLFYETSGCRPTAHRLVPKVHGTPLTQSLENRRIHDVSRRGTGR